MTETLNERGLRDTITGLEEINRAIRNAARAAEQKVAEGETELLALRKLTSYVAAQIDDAKAALDTLMGEQT
ncbi:hypothetical protein PQJ75_00955 [Rhodoplanes sp. TEM]|uniref:Uncharacterized protein n=1 Tax=Rhodoplanes tepidamans TaxID=200616 RepID=A0ABT5J5V5_RHOTP|nr:MULTISPECIES: hypothetical protein [Rhodoplanes]MDC7784822.1 hypothetical protein [Rhodoplanes tepidamans]MDC7982289.1 hypothetical protein [Rhodoplanes sp. TEM]MDQ0356297.1 hypothetical protein [Rhodoplanes tepidamans]